MNDLTIIQPLDTALVTLDPARPNAYRQRSKAPGTIICYEWHWAKFLEWCATRRIPIDLRMAPVPAGWVADHLAEMADAGLSYATICQRSAAIAYFHKLDRQPSPTKDIEVVEVVQGIARTLGVAPKNQKHAATADLLLAMLNTIDRTTLIGKRNRAALALGFGAALRRSELVALCVSDLTPTPQGVDVLVRRSKTDQTGAGYVIAVPAGQYIKPWDLVQEWLRASGVIDGAIFRQVKKGGRVQDDAISPDVVVMAIKKAAEECGLDATKFSGHSLRAGFVTSAVQAGAKPTSITEVTRHKSLDMILDYTRRRDRYEDHAGRAFM